MLQQMIAELGVEPYYYTTANSTGEIDFMLQAPGSVIPVEVKAEENLRAKSLRAFCEKYHPKHAVRTSMSDFREQDWMTNIPLYNIDSRFQKQVPQAPALKGLPYILSQRVRSMRRPLPDVWGANQPKHTPNFRSWQAYFVKIYERKWKISHWCAGF